MMPYLVLTALILSLATGLAQNPEDANRPNQNRVSAPKKDVVVVQNPLSGGHDQSTFLRGFFRRRPRGARAPRNADPVDVGVQPSSTQTSRAAEDAVEEVAPDEEVPMDESSREQRRRAVAAETGAPKPRPSQKPRAKSQRKDGPMGEDRDDVMEGRDRDVLRRRWKIEDGDNRVANFRG